MHALGLILTGRDTKGPRFLVSNHPSNHSRLVRTNTFDKHSWDSQIAWADDHISSRDLIQLTLRCCGERPVPLETMAKSAELHHIPNHNFFLLDGCCGSSAATGVVAAVSLCAIFASSLPIL